MQRTEDDRLCFKTPPLMKNSSFYVYHLWSFLIIQYWYWGCLLSSWVTHDDILCFIFGRGKFEVDSGHELDELEQDQNDEEGDRRRDDDQSSGGSGLNILGGYFPILVQLLRWAPGTSRYCWSAWSLKLQTNIPKVWSCIILLKAPARAFS